MYLHEDKELFSEVLDYSNYFELLLDFFVLSE